MLTKYKNKLLNPLFFFVNDCVSFLGEKLSPIIKQTPFVLKIRITTKCNLSCPFCYLKDGLNRVEEEHLSIEEWRKVLGQLPKYTIVDITGAEPFAYKNLVPFIQLLKELKLRYSITTNGTIYNETLVEELVLNDLQVLMVSLDGLEHTHNELRGNPKAFSKTIEFIKKIEEAKKKYNKKTPLINIKTTVLDENCEDLISLVDFCRSRFHIDIYTYTFLFQNEARGGMELYDTFSDKKFQRGNYAKYKKVDEVSKFVKDIKNKMSQLDFPIVIKPRMNFKNLLRYIQNPVMLNVEKCPQYLNNVTLYYNGDLAPCDIGLKVGNIRNLNYDLSKVYKTKDFISFKNQMTPSHPVCQGCCSGCHK